MPNSNALRRNLFDTLPSWINDPQNSYATWVSQQPYKRSTQIVYIAMFSRFCSWLQSEGKRLDQCTADDIARFLAAPNPTLPESRRVVQTTRQRQQYVRQLERVFEHLGSLGLQSLNPGREAGYQRIGHGRDQPTRFLDGNEREIVIRQLREGPSDSQAGADTWIACRDLALVAVLLGAGLKVGHLPYLTLNCIDWAESRIELSNRQYTHRARLFPFAVPALQRWIAVQGQLHGGSLPAQHPVFEADRSTGFGRMAKSSMLHPSGIHRRTQKFLENVGITGSRASAQTLRNTYAALLIEGGASDDELVDFMGLHASITARRLRTAYSRFLQPPVTSDSA